MIEGLNENYSPEDSSKASEQASERFREQQAKGAAAAAAQKKREQSFKQKEDRIAAVLRKLLADGKQGDLLLLIARCLGKNIPAGFILGVIALVIEEAEKEFTELIGRPLLSPAQHARELALLGPGEPATSSESAEESSQALARVEGGALATQADFNPNRLPLEIKAAIEAWGFGLLEFARTNPARVLGTCRSMEKVLFPDLTNLAAAVLRTFLAREGLNAPLPAMQDFAELLLTGVLDRLESEQNETRKLGSGEA